MMSQLSSLIHFTIYRLGKEKLDVDHVINFVLLQASGSDDDGDREQKIRFEGEDHPETEKHDKLRRRDTPHYLKGKRIDLQSNNQDKVMEILAKAGNRDGDEGQNNESVRTVLTVSLSLHAHIYNVCDPRLWSKENYKERKAS